MSKPGKSLRNLCKKLGVRLTVKRGQKRVYKSVAVLKKQCANKKKVKKKKVKRKRKFGMPPGLLMTQKQIDDLHNKQKRNKFLLQAYKKFMTEQAVGMLKKGYTVLYTKILVGSVFKLNFMKMHQLTEDEYDYLIRGEEIDVEQLNKSIKSIPDQIKDYRDSQKESWARKREIPFLLKQSLEDRLEEARLEEARREEAHQARLAHQARQTRQEEARQARLAHQARIARLARLAEVQSHQARQEEVQAARQQRASDLVSDSNARFDWNVHGPYLGLGLGLAGAGGLGYLTHKFIKKQRKKRKKLTRFGKKKKRKVKRKRKKIKKKLKRRK